MDLKEKYPNLYSYIIINEALVYNAANDFIKDVTDDVLKYIDCGLEFEQYSMDVIKNKDKEKIYSGWCYDSIKQKFVDTDDTTKYHPVYFVYHIAYMGNVKNYLPEYRCGYMRVRNRDIKGKNKRELINDEIVVDLFITNIANISSEYDRKTSLEVMFAHECKHIMELYPLNIKYIPNYDKDEAYSKITKDLYANILGKDFYEDKASDEIVRDISLGCYFFSHMERNAIKESIAFYN